MSGWIIVDRIENGVAACETPDGSMRMIPAEVLPEGVKEGDCLRERGGRYVADPMETLRRREENRALLRSLTQSKPQPPEDDGNGREKRKELPGDGFSLK